MVREINLDSARRLVEDFMNDKCEGEVDNSEGCVGLWVDSEYKFYFDPNCGGIDECQIVVRDEEYENLSRDLGDVLTAGHNLKVYTVISTDPKYVKPQFEMNRPELM